MDKKKYYYDCGYGVQFFLYGEDIKNICHSGSNDAEVAECLSNPEIAHQFDKYSTEEIREEASEILYEDDEYKTASREKMIFFLVWNAAWFMFEDEEGDWYKDQKDAA